MLRYESIKTTREPYPKTWYWSCKLCACSSDRPLGQEHLNLEFQVSIIWVVLLRRQNSYRCRQWVIDVEFFQLGGIWFAKIIFLWCGSNLAWILAAFYNKIIQIRMIQKSISVLAEIFRYKFLLENSLMISMLTKL